MDATNLAELYDCPIVDWSTITDRLDRGIEQAPGSGDGPRRHTCWLATINADGSPHVNGIGALWFDGSFWFETSETSRKGRNIARDPRCSISVATFEFDLTIEGTAQLIDDPKLVAAAAARWNPDWPCEVDESGVALTAPFSAPSAGPPPWRVYRIVATRAQALTTTGEDGGATRWTF